MVDKLRIILAVLRFISISLQLISVARKLFFKSFVVLLVLMRLVATAVKLAQYVLRRVKGGQRIEKDPSSKADDATARGFHVTVSDY